MLLDTNKVVVNSLSVL